MGKPKLIKYNSILKPGDHFDVSEKVKFTDDNGEETTVGRTSQLTIEEVSEDWYIASRDSEPAEMNKRIITMHCGDDKVYSLNEDVFVNLTLHYCFN